MRTNSGGPYGVISSKKETSISTRKRANAEARIRKIEIKIRQLLDEGSKIEAKIKPPTLSGMLREAIRESHLSAGQLAKQAGVQQPTITEFSSWQGIRLETAERLAEALGVTFTPHKMLRGRLIAQKRGSIAL